MNNKEFLDNYFFVFDSDNFDTIKTKIYGYSICKDGGNIIISNQTKNIIGGCYILIEKNDNEIIISQDDLSSMYLYYYKDDNYWAVGNSFYNLCKLLKEKQKHITVRNLYIDQYIHQNLHVYSCNRTMVNEVYVMPCFSEMRLTRHNLEIIEKNSEFETVELFSKNGMQIIDNWIDKWSTVIKAVYDNHMKIKIDLSGGFDSRVIFCLASNAGIDLNASNIDVFSKIGKTKGMITHLDDDYAIAEQIADKKNFILNLHEDIFKMNNIKNNSECQYEILRNLFMFTHKEGYLCTVVHNEPMIHLGGINGELARRKLEGFVNYNDRCYNDPFRKSQDVIDEFIKDLDKCYEKSNSMFERNARMYLETQNKSHYGASIYNDFITNTFLISPFNDKSLFKLKIPNDINPNIIFAIIIYRTSPDIFDIKFSSNREFEHSVKEYTKILCDKYPKKQQIYDLTCQFDYSLKNISNENIDNKNGEHVLFDTFLKNKDVFVNYISNVWGERYANDLYEFAKEFYLNKDNFFPNKWIVTITSIIELLNLLKK